MLFRPRATLAAADNNPVVRTSGLPASGHHYAALGGQVVSKVTNVQISGTQSHRAKDWRGSRIWSSSVSPLDARMAATRGCGAHAIRISLAGRVPVQLPRLVVSST